MKTFLLAVLLLLASQTALAQHHHHRGHYRPGVGVYFGVPYPWGGVPYVGVPYPPAYYYPPRVVYPPAVTVQEPPVYIEQQTPVPLPPPPTVQYQQTFEPGYWYYCHERSAYYPSVKSCPGPWQQVGPSNR